VEPRVLDRFELGEPLAAALAPAELGLDLVRRPPVDDARIEELLRSGRLGPEAARIARYEG